MSSINKNLSDFSSKNVKAISKYTFAIVVAEWNEEITESLYQGAYETLISHGADTDKIIRTDVPGSFELTLGAQRMAQKTNVDAVICLGCVIQGETKHFNFICNAVANGLTNVSLKYDKPVIFGVITPNTQKQALDRSGGKYGNKGDEAAIATVKMLAVLKH